MKRYSVELLPAAYTDLDAIFDYIMADNPSAATDMLESIMAALGRLEYYPHSGALLLDRALSKYSFRMVVDEPYVTFYRCIGDAVLVYRILHGARDYASLLRNIPK